jgi:hypothetical protein
MKLGYLVLLASCVLAVGCSDESEAPAVAGCPQENVVGGVCAGVPAEALSETVTTTGSCTSVVQVANMAELDTALAGASDGGCIALLPGIYGSITLPVGVSLFGHHHADTVVAGVLVMGGSDVRLRGFAVQDGTISVSVGTTHIDAVRVEGGSGSGVSAGASASVTIERSTIGGKELYGVEAFNVGSVSVKGSVIAGNGAGMWVQRDDGCMGTGTVSAAIEDSVLRSNHLVGLSLVGASATMDNVAVRDSLVGQNFEAGGGIAISGCSTVTATAVEVLRSVDFGVLIDGSTVSLSGAVVSENGVRGVQIQNITDSVTIEDAVIEKNVGLGIGIDGASTSVTVRNTTISGTSMISLPVLVNGVSAGADEVGDGITWLDGSFVTIEGVSVSSSARASVLIDGPVAMGSVIHGLTLGGGDEAKGVVQQNLPMDGTQPETMDAPPIMQQPGEMFSIPAPVPVIPPGI